MFQVARSLDPIDKSIIDLTLIDGFAGYYHVRSCFNAIEKHLCLIDLLEYLSIYNSFKALKPMAKDHCYKTLFQFYWAKGK